LFEQNDHPLLEEIRKLNIDQLTPLDALGQLQAWQTQLGPIGKPSKG
jgi:hypothetical protein